MLKLEKKIAGGLFIIFCLLLLLLSLLLSCTYFFGSYFPNYLSQVVQVLDLSDKLTASSYTGFNLAVMNNNSVCTEYNNEYIFLSTYPQNQQPMLYVINPDNLQIQTEFSAPTCAPSCGYYRIDKFYMVDNAGGFRVGAFTVDSMAYIDPTPRPVECNYGLTFGEDYELRVGDSPSFPSNKLRYGALGNFNISTATPIPIDENQNASYNLQNVYYDKQQAVDRKVMLAFYRSSENDRRDAYVFFMSAFPPIFTSPTLSLMTEPDKTIVYHIIIPDMNTENTGIFYTRAGIIVNHNSGNIRKLYSFSGEELAAAPNDDKDWLKTAYDLEGNYYYVFNSREKQLYKCHTWWNK